MIDMPDQLAVSDMRQVPVPTNKQETALRNLLTAAGACGAADMYQNASTAPALQHDNRLHILQLALRAYLNTQGEGFGDL